MEAINLQLNMLYQNIVSGPLGAPFFEDKNFSSPLLIKFADDRTIETADLRVMFFGQETLEWVKGSIDEAMNTYRGFFNDFDYYPQVPDSHCWHKQKSSSGTWRVLEQMKNKINERLPDKRISYIWNNICKVDYEGRKVPYNVYSKIRDVNRDLILNEIEIIKPDVLVFFTGGKNYGYRLGDVFNNGQSIQKKLIDFDGNKNVLVKASLPIYGDAYVTYHPLALETRPAAKDFVLNAIVEQCAETVAKKTGT